MTVKEAVYAYLCSQNQPIKCADGRVTRIISNALSNDHAQVSNALTQLRQAKLIRGSVIDKLTYSVEVVDRTAKLVSAPRKQGSRPSRVNSPTHIESNPHLREQIVELLEAVGEVTQSEGRVDRELEIELGVRAGAISNELRLMEQDGVIAVGKIRHLYASIRLSPTSEAHRSTESLE